MNIQDISGDVIFSEEIQRVADSTLAEALAASFDKTPDAPAVTLGKSTLTYAELDVRTRALASALRKKGVAAETVVAIALPRSIEAIVAIIATIRAGGAYLPISLEDPITRSVDLLEESEAVVLLAEKPIGKTPAFSPQDWPIKGAAPDLELAPENLAYVLYTSGSTGKPKGVLIEHAAVMNSVLWAIVQFGFDATDRVLHKSPLAFDISVWEIFAPLVSGGELVLAPEGAHRDPRAILSLIQENNITAVHFVPTMLNLFLDVIDPETKLQIARVLTGGEALLPAQRDRVHQLIDTHLHNTYGPTEAAVTVSHWHAHFDDASNPLPIGRPIWNTRLYVLDDSLQKLKPGQKGRLWLAGRQLARGYLKRPDLTTERFVDDPFVAGERMYDSGDLAEMREDGSFVYHGRADTQIKIRGIRLELGEVESALETQPNIEQAIVVVRDDLGGNEPRLAAFCIGSDIDEPKVRKKLSTLLPPHAVPARIIAVESFPFGAVGKVDRRALADLNVELPKRGKRKANTLKGTASTITEALAEILSVEAVEIDRAASFFDLGATSLQLIQLRERLHEEIQQTLPISDFFLYSSVDTLAKHLDAVDAIPEKSVSTAQDVKSDLIAIVGMAGRFPGANSVDEFWEGLVEGREMISHFSEDELDFDPRQTNSGTDYVLSRGIMHEPQMFDAKHFGIPPREAERLDPQHRIMLEVAQTALEDAAHDPDRFDGRIGIFCGASQSSYLLNNLLSAPGAARELAASYPVKDFATTLGNDKDFLATRLAYKLNLTGPAMTVQTACSTALTAVSQACSALQTGQADMVLAGAVSVTFPTKRPYAYLSEGMASADGHCRTFDAAASGTVFGDGAGIVVLRRLEDALADGDKVVAVIRGVGINNDGAEKAGFAAPSIRAQADAITSAHQAAGIEPSQIGYVEAHGTATPLGDPIEFAALQAAFGSKTTGQQFCALGSAKTNIGHLDIAAGIAGLIKTALVLKHGKIPPLLHYTKPNPQIDFENSAFFPVQKLTDWKRGETSRLAGVSAFGVGGTNIHVVLEEAPETGIATSKSDDGLRVFPLSGSTPEAVAESISNLGAFAETNPNADPDQVVATLRHGRREYQQRAVLVARDMAGLAKAAENHKGKPAKAATRSGLAFLFPGQGAQHVGMGRHLFEQAPVFREALSMCNDLLEPELGLSLLDVIHAPIEKSEEMTDRLRDTSIAQPAIFATSFALAKHWAHWGIAPDVMVGHSIGEFVAATLADVVDVQDALKLIALRGRLMADLPAGVMVSVRASEDEITPYLGAGLDLAAVNGAKAVVLAGSEEACEAILPKIEADGFVASKLHTSHAFHSHMMESALPPFQAALEKIRFNPPKVPILSTVTTDWLTDDEATSTSYWANHMRRPVRFYDAIQTLWAEGLHMFVESGPGRTLSTLAAQNPDRSRAQPALASLPHAQAAEADSHIAMLEAFGQLWAHGYQVDWRNIDEGRPKAKRLSGLPTYPFQRKRHWIEPAEITSTALPLDELALEVDDTFTSQVTEIEPLDAPSAVRSMLSDLSGVDPSEMEGSATFLELGFDSLLLTQATREILDRFGVAVSLRELIDGYPNIDALAAHIADKGTLDHATAANITETETTQPEPEQASFVTPTESSAPVTKISRETEALRKEQRAHIDKVVRRFCDRTPKSKALTQEYRQYHADPRTAAGFNRLWKEAIYQVVSDRSKGSRIIDVDGNEYVDLLNGFGPGFLGHTNDMVNDAISERMARGYEVGPQHIEAMEAAKLFCEVTGNERASFVCTGSEAVYAAMRLARTVTNRDTIVIFQRDYHGNFDEVLVRGIDAANGPRTLPLTPGIPRDSVKNIVVLPYGTAESLDWIRKNAQTLAAVVVEPVQSRRPEFRPVEFVQAVRRITAQSGALMVFDEVVTGFRFGPRGAQSLYGIEADLVTYGKIVGGEMPVGVVAGKARYMDTFDGGQWAYGDDSFPEAPVTFFAGTFVRHPLAMAAVRAMLTYMKAQPDYFWRSISAKGDKLAGTLHRWFEDNDMPFELPNCGSMMYLRAGEEQRFGGLLGIHLRSRGVFLLEGFPCYLTASHDDEDIAFAIDAFKDSALEMRADGMLIGREAVPYDGPHVTSAPPRLSLPDGRAKIASQMAQPPSPLPVPTTTAQQEILAAQLIAPELAAGYNENYAIELRGKGIDISRLKEAVIAASRRHDALSATFSADSMEMYLGATAAEISYVDVSEKTDPDGAVNQMWQAAASQPFDLATGPLARFQIVKRAEDSVDLMITAHHVVFDGWSGGTILRDICRIYDAKVKGTLARLPEISSPCDFSIAERTWSDSNAATVAQNYWSDLFSDLPKAVTLPSLNGRGATRNVAAARADIEIPAATVSKLREASKSMGVTLFSLLFAAFKLFVARSSAARDITIAVPSAGQPAYQLENLVFHCVNLMPVRSVVEPDQSFQAFVKTVSGNVLEASEHQKMTYGTIVRSLNIPREASQTPLTSMMFNLDPAFTDAELDFADVQANYRSIPRQFSNFEIDLNLSDKGDVVVAEWTYQTALFNDQRISAFMDGFIDLLERAIEAPEAPLDALLSASDDETDELAVAAIGPSLDIPEATLHKLISQQALLTPSELAVETTEGSLDYATLDSLANRLARSLIAKGVKPGDIVGISVRRSAWSIVCLLAAMKSGAAYLPLDPKLPKDRLRYMVEDSGSVLVLVDHESESVFEPEYQTLVVDEDCLDVDATEPAVKVTPTDLAYILYTSGSTGKPKGVRVSHRAFVNFIASMTQEPGLGRRQRVLALTTISFDIAGLEIWGPLSQGGTVVLANTDEVMDAAALIDKIDTCDLMQATPATYHILLESGWRGKADLVVLIGGEPVPQEIAASLVSCCHEVWNMYGPTETTIWSTICKMDGKKVRVGRPIANTDIRIVDSETLGTQPPGTIGELLIGGAGLADGYHNLPELTKERFIELAENGTQKLFFRTGDLARFSQDENDWSLEILGRLDSQIKLRGYRIEIGEVESALLQCDDVSRAVVILQNESTANAFLAAVVVLNSEGALNEEALRNQLAQRLPAYMVPSRFLSVDTMPLNSSGKIDRRAISTILESKASAVAINPREGVTEQESQVLAIWQRQFPGREIGLDDNFFDLGGHSLMAVSLFESIRKEMGHDEPIATLIRHQTPRELANALTALHSDDAKSSDKTALDDTSDWDTSTLIHPGPETGAQLPIFIAGGVGGNVNNLFALGQHLGRTRPVIGFQTRGVMGHQPHETIEAMASEHIRYMRQYQSTGPYILAGYSGGAYTALEIARQLEAMGEEVQQLIILDIYAPLFRDKLAQSYRLSLRERFWGEMELLQSNDFRMSFSRIKFVLQKVFARYFKKFNAEEPSLAETRNRIMTKAWFAAARKFVGGGISGPITLALSTPKTIGRIDVLAKKTDPSFGWRELTPEGNFQSVQFHGDHLDMLTDENVERNAEVLEQILYRVVQEAAE